MAKSLSVASNSPNFYGEMIVLENTGVLIFAWAASHVITVEYMEYSWFSYYFYLCRSLLFNYSQLSSSRADTYKDEGHRRRKSKKYQNDSPALSKNDSNHMRRPQV